AYGPGGTFLGNAKLGFLTGIEDHVERVTGQPIGTRSSDEAANAWMHESWATEMGVEDGEQFILQPILQGLPVKVRIAGTWRPRDVDDPFWPSNPDSLWRSVLLLQPDDYAAMVEPALGGASVGSLSWAVNLHEERFVPELADRYVQGFKRSLVRLQQLLPDAHCDVSPLPVLLAYLGRRHSLTILLFAFSVPIVGFLLYSLTLVSNVLVDGQRPSTAIMASRGMSPAQLLRVSLFEGLFLLAVGTPLGVLVGLTAARLMGHSVSFLRFEARSPLQVTMAGIRAWLILLTMAVSLLARLWPAIRESGRSVVDYLQEASRPQGRPGWQKLYLDFVLIIPTLYAYRQLKQQGSIVILGWRSSGDIFRDPALFLVPALFMLTASLLCARLFPLLMRLLDRAISGHLGLAWCVTLRQLGRQGRQYVSPLLLIMISVGVGAFMACMALSLDRWLEDRLRYRLGADVVLRVEDMPQDEAVGSSGAIVSSAVLIPLPNILAVPGVTGATNVGSYRAQIPVTVNALTSGRFLGIDRVTFSSAAAFRPDFAEDSLGELMNSLAMHEDGVLVSRQLLERGVRRIGDPLELRITPDGTTFVDMRTVIVGVFDYFPTVYEEEMPTVVGNLDYLMTVAGGVSTYDLWLRIDPRRASPEELERAISPIVSYYSRYQDLRTLLKEERDKKERIGVYGTLTVGFLACRPGPG
ncbi:MAG: FtsX-like permease family protein, partial [Anaerolineae bacterium]|nr:FtsX-like permease family protein [Anaerolineae bacterium]